MVLPDDGSGKARVALQFDLSSVLSGPGRYIDEALLEWTIAGVPSTTESSFEVRPVNSVWTAATVAGRLGLLDLGADPVSNWIIEPLDFERSQGLVRFDVTGLVRQWLEGESANYGVVVETGDLTNSVLSNQAGSATLTLRYCFVR